MVTIYVDKTGTDFSAGARFIAECGHAAYTAATGFNPAGMYCDCFSQTGLRCVTEYVLTATLDETMNFFGRIKFRTSTLAKWRTPHWFIGFMTSTGVTSDYGAVVGAIIHDNASIQCMASLRNPDAYHTGVEQAFAFVAETDYVIHITYDSTTHIITVELLDSTETTVHATDTLDIGAAHEFDVNYLGWFAARDYSGAVDNEYSDNDPASQHCWTITNLYADDNEPDVPPSGAGSMALQAYGARVI